MAVNFAKSLAKPLNTGCSQRSPGVTVPHSAGAGGGADPVPARLLHRAAFGTQTERKRTGWLNWYLGEGRGPADRRRLRFASHSTN